MAILETLFSEENMVNSVGELKEDKEETESPITVTLKNWIFKAFEGVFQDLILQPGKGYKVNIPIDKQATSIFKRYSNIPYSLTDKVKKKQSQ